MSLQTILLTPEQVTELSQPFGPTEAKVAMMAGFAEVISQAGMLLSEAEELLIKSAMTKEGDGIADAVLRTLGNVGIWYPLGLGALGGAYTAYERNNLEKDLKDRNDPEISAIKQKIKTYRSMTDDLNRTNTIESGKDAVPVPA